MSFVAAAPAPAIDPAVDPVVTGDGWFPDLEIEAFRRVVRVGNLVTPARAREAILGGMVSAADALVDWRAAHEAAGVVSLETVPGPQLGGEARVLILWRRAVFSFAAADLAETHNDIGASDTGRAHAEAKAVSADEHRRNATVAIRDLLGRGRSKVALI